MRYFRLIILLFIFFILSSHKVAISGVADTKHNLSVSGPGEIKAATETEICIFCHVPHNANPIAPLWGRSLEYQSGIIYTPYFSETLEPSFLPGRPQGATSLCLSCHDGTVALGKVLNRSKEIRMIDTSGKSIDPDQSISVSSPGYIGTDLSGSHPVSFAFTDGLALDNNSKGEFPLKIPSQIADREFHLDKRRLECTACHDPHKDDFRENAKAPFWRKNTWQDVCYICHDFQSLAVSIPDAAHKNSSTLPNLCGSCHKGHGLKRTPMLIQNEENLCFLCHGDSRKRDAAVTNGLIASGIALADIEKEFSKPYRHPIELKGVHKEKELLRKTGGNVQRHSECVDCHPAHGAIALNQRSYSKEFKRKASTNSKFRYEYELCYECHAESAAILYPSTDKSAEFSSSNPSFHPVQEIGRGSDIPSLIPPYNTTSIISCTDCHSGDESSSTNPHGSVYPYILGKNYTLEDGIPESEFTYAICYKCHLRENILSDRSFAYHRKHILDKQTSCYTCHDSHSSRDYPALIRFNKDPRFTKVGPSSSGRLQYFRKGRFKGECYLACHGVDHNPKEY